MLRCAYIIFTTEVNVNATTSQVSAKNFFSHLTLKGPGTTDFSCVVGLWGLEKGSTSFIELLITLPDQQVYTAKWGVTGDKDEIHVHNGIFNCSSLPLETEGLYSFKVIEQGTYRELAQRFLRVSFSGREGELYE